MKKNIFVNLSLLTIALIFSIVCLWINETSHLNKKKNLKEIKEKIVLIDSNDANAQNNNNLVYLSDNLKYSEGAGDYIFDVYTNSSKLTRYVEKYQYKEIVKEDEEGNITYSYKKVWSDKLINSNTFNNKSYVNDSNMLYETSSFYADDLMLGSFTLSQTLKEQLLTTKVYNELDEIVATAYNLKINDIYYTNSEKLDEPNIGDIRISFLYNENKKVTILAMQSEDTFSNFVTKTGVTYNKLVEYETTPSKLINNLINEDNTITWLLRTFLIIILFVLIYLIVLNIYHYNERLPLFGKLSSKKRLLLSLLLSLTFILVIVALVWLIYSFLIFIACLVLIALMTYFILKIYQDCKIIEENSKLMLYKPEVVENNNKETIASIYEESI